ncbi:MAG: P-loop NTPase, partial [Clostridia bacterium]|nr:P-loop NTPase [Clostridia bacterium]
MIYTIASGKGGVGKTMLTANLGAALALCGKRVAVVDGDIGLRNLDMALGLEHSVLYDLADVAEHRCEVEDALITHPRISTLHLLPAPQGTPLPPGGMAWVAGELARDFDYVLIDAPAGVGPDVMAYVDASDGLIAVTLPEPSALRDCDRIIRMALKQKPGKVMCVLNRANPKAAKRGYQLKEKQAEDILETKFAVVIPEDRLLGLADSMPPAARR